jgi:hypothetical protein
MIDSVATEKFCETKFNDWLKKYGPKEIEQYLLLQTLLPTDIEIDKILSISSCVREQITLPVIRDSVLDVNIVFRVTDGGRIVELKGTLQVELKYQKFAFEREGGMLDYPALMVSSLKWLGSNDYGYESTMLGNEPATTTIHKIAVEVHSLYTRKFKFKMPINTFLGMFGLDNLALEGDNGKKINLVEKAIEAYGLTSALVDKEFVSYELSVLEIHAISDFTNNVRNYPNIMIKVLTSEVPWSAETDIVTKRGTTVSFDK